MKTFFCIVVASLGWDTTVQNWMETVPAAGEKDEAKEQEIYRVKFAKICSL